MSFVSCFHMIRLRSRKCGPKIKQRSGNQKIQLCVVRLLIIILFWFEAWYGVRSAISCLTLLLDYIVGDLMARPTCDICFKTFASKGNLSIHIRDQHEMGHTSNICPFCNKLSKNPSALRVHIRTYHRQY